MDMIVMYGAAWCGDCARTKFFFDTHGIAYEYHDIDEEQEVKDIVARYNNNGNMSIPVVVFPDNTYLIEPTYQQLEAKLGDDLGAGEKPQQEIADNTVDNQGGQR